MCVYINLINFSRKVGSKYSKSVYKIIDKNRNKFVLKHTMRPNVVPNERQKVKYALPDQVAKVDGDGVIVGKDVKPPRKRKTTKQKSKRQITRRLKKEGLID